MVRLWWISTNLLKHQSHTLTQNRLTDWWVRDSRSLVVKCIWTKVIHVKKQLSDIQVTDIYPLDYIRLEFQYVDFECRVFSSEDCWGPTCRSCLYCREFNTSPGNNQDPDTFTTWHILTCNSSNSSKYITTSLRSLKHFSLDSNWFFWIRKDVKWPRLNQIKVKCSDRFIEMTKQHAISNGHCCLCPASVQSSLFIRRHPHN